MASPASFQTMRAVSAESAPTPISAGDLETQAEVALDNANEDRRFRS